MDARVYVGLFFLFVFAMITVYCLIPQEGRQTIVEETDSMSTGTAVLWAVLAIVLGGLAIVIILA